jgi:hypothetical protein
VKKKTKSRGKFASKKLVDVNLFAEESKISTQPLSQVTSEAILSLA